MSTPMTSTELAGYKAGLSGEKGWDSLHSDDYVEARRAGHVERELTKERLKLIEELEAEDD